jgi:hypothetical protein
MRAFKHALASKAHAHACACADMRADMHTYVLQLKAEVRRGIEISAGVTSKKDETQEREVKWQRLRSEYEEQLKSMEECIKKERGAGARRNTREFEEILHAHNCIHLRVSLQLCESLYLCAVAQHTRTHADMRERAEKDRFQAEEALEKLISSVELIRDSGNCFFLTRVRQYLHLRRLAVV